MKNKKGKKLVVLGAMAALLTLIGVSGSQTYAKYVESFDVESEQATVAKWGYVVTVDSSNLFGSSYDDVDGTLASVANDSDGLVVKAHTSDTRNVVAPGTKGELVINVNGYAEVDAVLSFSELTASEITLNSQYYPVIWDAKVVGNGLNEDYALGGPETGKLSSVYAWIKTLEYHFEAGTDVDLTITLSWSWAFDNTLNLSVTGEASDLINGAGNLTADEADTYLAILGNSQDTSVANAVNTPKYELIKEKYPVAADKSVLSTSLSFELTMTQEQKETA